MRSADLWPWVPIRKLARLGTGHTPSRQHPEYWENCRIPWLTLADVGRFRNPAVSVVSDTEEQISEVGLANSAAELHPAGTVVLSRTASVGFSAILGRDMATSQDFATWTCGPRLVPQFLLHALRGEPQEIERRKMGSTHQTIYMPDIKTLEIPLPPVATQRKIVRHLDRETGQIDSLIAAKRRLVIALLAYRDGVLAEAVVGKAHQDLRSLEAGRFFGRIPAHWRSEKFSRCVDIAEGQVDPTIAPYYQLPLIAPNHVEQATGRLSGVETAEEQGAISGKYLCEPGDVVYSKIRPALRKATRAPGPSLCSADMYPLRPRAGMLASYLLLVVLSEQFTHWAVTESERVAMPKINREALADVRIPVPPESEQEQIVSRVRALTDAIDQARAAVQRSINLLAEGRQALTTAVVTGELRV